MLEFGIYVLIVVFVGFLIIPTKKSIKPKQHYARPEGCTCPEYTKWSVTIDYNCPIHGDWR